MKKIILLVTLFVVTLSVNAQDLNGNTYKIQSTANNKMLDASARDLGKNGGAIQLWDNVDVPHQNWKFVYANKGANIYYITTASRKAGKHKYLDASARDYGKNGGALQLWEDNGYAKGSGAEANQLWVVTKNVDGTYRIVNAHPKTKGTSLDANPSNQNGRKVQMWESINHKNQAWKLVSLNKKEKKKNSTVHIPVGNNRIINYIKTENGWVEVSNTLDKGKTLKAGESLLSKNQKYILNLSKEDGHLCIYEYNNHKKGKFIWGTNVHGFKNARLELNKNGDVLVYDGQNNVKWSIKKVDFSNTSGKSDHLEIGDDGKLKLFNNHRKVIWKSK